MLTLLFLRQAQAMLHLLRLWSGFGSDRLLLWWMLQLTLELVPVQKPCLWD